MNSKIPLLVTTDWLQSNLHDRNLRIIDCRWVLGKTGEGRRQYESGHIPGAVHLDVDTDLSGDPQIGPGRHPLPSKQDFQRVVSGAGVHHGAHVVAYDEGRGMPAARLWWLLRYFGHENVSVLDGGWQLWKNEERPSDTMVPQYPAADFKARPKLRRVVEKEMVDSLREERDVLLIDARAPERYRGETEPVDARPGHIPGAKNFPFLQVIDPSTGRFLPADQLRSRFKELGAAEAEKIICYCGSGVTACTLLFALQLAGVDDAKLYPGSWSEWSKDSNLPAATAVVDPGSKIR